MPSGRFNLNGFIEECQSTLSQTFPPKAAREILEGALAKPGDVIKEVGEPAKAGVTPLYRGSDLTILNVIWGPGMSVMPHNHEMWAVIGIYTGREDNIFWRRLPDDAEGRVEPAGAGTIGIGEALPLGRYIIHSVTNPIYNLTGAIHVYGGDFFGAARSEWDPLTLEERPYDVKKNMALFERSNALLPAA